MGLKSMLIGFVLVGLFSLSLLNFTIQTQLVNNASTRIINDPAISGFNETLTSNLEDFDEETQAQREVFEQEETQKGIEDFGLTSIYGVVKSFVSISFVTINIIFSALSDFLGIPAIVIGIIFGSMIIAFVIYMWRTIKVGGT